jgi:hypothetical protein
MIHIKPSLSALGQLLQMAAHKLDWGDSLNQRHRRGKWLTMVMMFVRGVVSVLDRIPILFLPYKTYGAGVLCSCHNPSRGKAVKGKRRRPAFGQNWK